MTLRTTVLCTCLALAFLGSSADSQAYEHATYTIFGKGGPGAGPQIVVSDPWDPVASPRGWLYWPEWAAVPVGRTVGNNVRTTLVALNQNTGEYHNGTVDPTTVDGERLFYSYEFDALRPATDIENMYAAAINAHYWTNRLHDIYWKFGFDEAAGNLQRENLTGSGLGNDFVWVVVRDAVGLSSMAWGAEGGGSPQLELLINPNTGRSSALDLKLIAHEYQHAVTNRLVGSPYDFDTFPYHTTFGMFSEGWSDFAGLMVSQTSANQTNQATPMFSWSNPTARRLPYSYDMSTNSQTLGLLDTDLLALNAYKSYNNAELWVGALWDLNKVLIEKYGYAEDLLVGYDGAEGASNAGNVLAFKMMLLSMDMLPELGIPILGARDAMFTADQMLTGGENLVEMWRVFARRGWGYSAQIVGSGAVEAFDLPPNLSGYQAGDFDVDGDVDGNDFLEWQRNFGSRTNFWADANLNGIVDAADYVIWRDHFGEGGASTLAAVPEPSSGCLLLVATAGVVGLRRHRHSA